MKHSISNEKDKDRLVTEEPLIIVPELYESRLKAILVHSLILVDERSHHSAIAGGRAVRLLWPGFRAA